MTHLKNTVEFKFVDEIPQKLIQNKIYISMNHATAVHVCLCGCREEVVTPFSPNDWKIVFDGNSITLRPSIGNWSFDCQSHYWITNNQVKWARKFTKPEIASVRLADKVERSVKNDKIEIPTQDSSECHRFGFLSRFIKTVMRS